MIERSPDPEPSMGEPVRVARAPRRASTRAEPATPGAAAGVASARPVEELALATTPNAPPIEATAQVAVVGGPVQDVSVTALVAPRTVPEAEVSNYRAVFACARCDTEAPREA